MERNEFTRSEFEEQEKFEQEFTEGNPSLRGSDSQNNARDQLKAIQERNLKRIQEKGIGHSKDPKKPSWNNE